MPDIMKCSCLLFLPHFHRINRLFPSKIYFDIVIIYICSVFRFRYLSTTSKHTCLRFSTCIFQFILFLSCQCNCPYFDVAFTATARNVTDDTWKMATNKQILNSIYTAYKNSTDHTISQHANALCSIWFFFIPFIPSLMNNKHPCSTANIS